MTKLLTHHTISPSYVELLGATLDSCWKSDVEPDLPVTDQALAGAAMLLTSRMLVALRNQLEYFKLERQPSRDFVVKFAELTESTVEIKTIKAHVDWLIADGAYDQDAIFEDTAEWAELNYKLLTFITVLIITITEELDDSLKADERLSDYLLPSVLLRRVAQPGWLQLPTFGRTKYMLVRRLVKKVRWITNHADCPLPV